MMGLNILLTSAGRRKYLVEYFQEVLKDKGKVYASNSKFSSALVIADDFVITPLIYDNNYISFLVNYAKEKNINVIIPLFDIDLPVLAKSKKIFKEIGVNVIVSDYEVTQICNDKWLSYIFLMENGFNTPKTYINYSKALEDLKKGVLSFPLILKPRWGMGSIGIYKIENILELQVLYKRVIKEIKSTYLQFESTLKSEEVVLIQECISGQEYGIDIFNDLDGNYLKTFVKRKIAMRSGETDYAITEDHGEIQELGNQLSQKLKHIGNLDVDLFLSENKLFVLEMNCRFGGGYPFTHLAGANLPKVLVDLLQSNSYDPNDLIIEYDLEMEKDIRPVKIKSK